MIYLCVVDGEKAQYLRSAVVINPVDLASDKDADLAVLPPLLVGQQVWDQQGQTWTADRVRDIKQLPNNSMEYSVIFKMKDIEHLLCLSWRKVKVKISQRFFFFVCTAFCY